MLLKFTTSRVHLIGSEQSQRKILCYGICFYLQLNWLWFFPFAGTRRQKNNIFLLSIRFVLKCVQNDHTNKKTSRRRNHSFTAVMTGVLHKKIYVNSSRKNDVHFKNTCGNIHYSNLSALKEREKFRCLRELFYDSITCCFSPSN